jgi:hypothetical protein
MARGALAAYKLTRPVCSSEGAAKEWLCSTAQGATPPASCFVLRSSPFARARRYERVEAQLDECYGGAVELVPSLDELSDLFASVGAGA